MVVLRNICIFCGDELNWLALESFNGSIKNIYFSNWKGFNFIESILNLVILHLQVTNWEEWKARGQACIFELTNVLSGISENLGNHINESQVSSKRITKRV